MNKETITHNEVLRSGNILVDISTPYSNKRTYCIELNKTYYEITKQHGEVVHFKSLSRKPRQLKEWQELSYNKLCTRIWDCSPSEITYSKTKLTY